MSQDKVVQILTKWNKHGIPPSCVLRESLAPTVHEMIQSGMVEESPTEYGIHALRLTTIDQPWLGRC